MVIPSISGSGGSATDYSPDWRYALTVKPGMIVQSETDSDIYFRTDDYIIFKNSGSYENAADILVYSTDGDYPASYLLKKTEHVISATSKAIVVNMPETPKKFHKILLADTNIIEIVSIVDSAGNNWYEVPFLAQDTIFEDELNTVDPDVGNIDETQYLLRLKTVNKRYVTKVTADNQIEILFGSGVSTEDDEKIIPNPYNVGSALIEGKNTSLDAAIDPSNFLYTKTYGDVPYNTSLTITYLHGGGIKSNVAAKDLTTISIVNYETNTGSLDPAVLLTVTDSVGVSNPTAAIGGRGAETTEEIRQNALAYFPTQQRAVTKEDYITRAYSLPAKYGSIAKAYITQDMQINKNNLTVSNPLALDLYTLAYDRNKYLTTCNTATKDNLKTYLNQYRMLTDAVNILDAYVINIGINFDIIALKSFNKNDVLLSCIDEVYRYFDSEKWQINQPIIIADIINLLFKVKGVQNVNNVSINNKWDSDDGYSGYSYSIEQATKDGILFPSLDPSCFELKFKNDIQGRAK